MPLKLSRVFLVFIVFALGFFVYFNLNPPKPLGSPVSLDNIEAMEDGKILGYEVNHGRILVSIVDSYGDLHEHLLFAEDDVSLEEALKVIENKRYALETP